MPACPPAPLLKAHLDPSQDEGRGTRQHSHQPGMQMLPEPGGRGAVCVCVGGPGGGAGW